MTSGNTKARNINSKDKTLCSESSENMEKREKKKNKEVVREGKKYDRKREENDRRRRKKDMLEDMSKLEACQRGKEKMRVYGEYLKKVEKSKKIAKKRKR